MKIYTKKGDQGQTSLFGGGPYPKDNQLIQAYGTVDELNSVVGLAATELNDEGIRKRVLEIQKQLFVMGAELSTVNPTAEMLKGFLQDSHVKALEQDIDAWEQELKPLQKFILPGGSKVAAHFHLARTVCRRAERLLVAWSHQESVRDEVLQYINRLSDWLFVLARLSNSRQGVEDILWEGILK